MLDPTTVSTLAPYAAAAVVLKAPVEDFLKRAFGPVADAIGQVNVDRFKDWRKNNIERTARRAAELAQAKGGEPQEIPMRTLLPLLEGASGEDDEKLAEMWASMLASAASSTQRSEAVPQYFPKILTQLSSADVLVLDLMYANFVNEVVFEALDGVELHPGWTLKGQIMGQLQLDVDEYDMVIVHLVGLGLVEIGARAFGSVRQDVVDKREVTLSVLGQRFMEACTMGRDSLNSQNAQP